MDVFSEGKKPRHGRCWISGVSKPHDMVQLPRPLTSAKIKYLTGIRGIYFSISAHRDLTGVTACQLLGLFPHQGRHPSAVAPASFQMPDRPQWKAALMHESAPDRAYTTWCAQG